MKTLDLEAVHAFVLVADLRSFTRAADALDSTQSTVSLKVKRLEDRLGHRLIERTPRMVRLSPKGEIFLRAARALLQAHDDALGALTRERTTLKVGISHHIVGPDLPLLLGHVHLADPGLLVELRVSSSRDVEADFDRGELDAALVLRHDDSRRDGDTLQAEPFGWMAAPGWTQRDGEPLRLATQAAPCRIRAMAVSALQAAGVPWVEVFVGGGIGTIAAAVQGDWQSRRSRVALRRRAPRMSVLGSGCRRCRPATSCCIRRPRTHRCARRFGRSSARSARCLRARSRA